MAYLTLTFNELMNRFPNPDDISPLLHFDDIDESLNIMEQCLELYDASAELMMYESQYTCAKALAFKSEKREEFTEMVKRIWLKIIEYIKMTAKYVIGIITWPLRIINKLLTKNKKIEMDIAIGLRHDGIEIVTSLEGMSKSIDEIKKEQGKIDLEYSFDLDKIKKIVKQCEELAELHYKPNFTVTGKLEFVDDISKSIIKFLEERSKIIENRKNILHEAIMQEPKAHPINMKTKKILDVLNNITESLKDTNKLASSAQNVESILSNVLDLLTSLERKIEKCTYEDIDAMKVEERESIYYTLSLIRAYITDFTALNVYISKHYRSIDNEIEKINNIAAFAHKSFTDDMVTETIGDVKVVVDDLFVFHDNRTNFIESEKKSAMIKTGGSSYHASQNNRSLKYKGNLIKIINYLRNYSTITITEGIYYLSQINKPSHLKNLYIGISQELQNNWYNYLMKTNSTGLTGDQYMQLQLWYEKKEYPRLLKIYKEYLRNLGIFEIGIIKPCRLQIGVRLRHQL